MAFSNQCLSIQTKICNDTQQPACPPFWQVGPEGFCANAKGCVVAKHRGILVLVVVCLPPSRPTRASSSLPHAALRSPRNVTAGSSSFSMSPLVTPPALRACPAPSLPSSSTAPCTLFLRRTRQPDDDCLFRVFARVSDGHPGHTAIGGAEGRNIDFCC